MLFYYSITLFIFSTRKAWIPIFSPSLPFSFISYSKKLLYLCHTSNRSPVHDVLTLRRFFSGPFHLDAMPYALCDVSTMYSQSHIDTAAMTDACVAFDSYELYDGINLEYLIGLGFGLDGAVLRSKAPLSYIPCLRSLYVHLTYGYVHLYKRLQCWLRFLLPLVLRVSSSLSYTNDSSRHLIHNVSAWVICPVAIILSVLYTFWPQPCLDARDATRRFAHNTKNYT